LPATYIRHKSTTVQPSILLYRWQWRADE